MVRAVFPGTFDPIHFGHIDIANRSAKLFDEIVIAVFDRPLKHLLFSPEDRMDLVRRSFIDKPKIKIMGYSGLTIDLCHTIDAQVVVRGLRVFSDFEYEFRMALANHRLAPDVESIAFITSEEHSFLSSSTVREIAALGGNVSSMVPKHVRLALEKRFHELGEEQEIVPQNSMRD